jgi:hypothetical protein
MNARSARVLLVAVIKRSRDFIRTTCVVVNPGSGRGGDPVEHPGRRRLRLSRATAGAGSRPRLHSTAILHPAALKVRTVGRLAPLPFSRMLGASASLSDPPHCLSGRPIGAEHSAGPGRRGPMLGEIAAPARVI